MGGKQLQFFSPLEAALAKIKKQEENLWGRMQSWSHRCLVQLENNPLLQHYYTFVKNREGAASLGRKPVIDLDSLFFLSLVFHLLLLFLLTRVTLPSSLADKSGPIRVQFLDLGKPVQAKVEKPEKEQKKVARVQPKVPEPSTATEVKTPSSAEKPVPRLPAPKLLAQVPPQEVAAPRRESVEALIQLPTKQSEAGQAAQKAKIDPLPAVAVEQGIALPAELRTGKSARTASRGKPGTAAGPINPDYEAYLKMIKKRVQSMWRFPEAITGSHLVYLSFVLDRAGKLVRVEVIDSTDSRLNDSALEAMKRASPFPPMPHSIKDLAGTELYIKFPMERVVKGVR